MNLNIVILAGGKGTRVREVLKDTPKIMAQIEGKPFLEWLLAWIDSWNLEISKNIILSTCIGQEIIKKYCEINNLNVKCVPEQKPLGTLGALANVASINNAKNYLVLNGDTIFKADFYKFHKRFSLEEDKPLIMLKKILKNDRYGGFEQIDNEWLFSKKRTEFISLGAFLISRDNLKKRWLSATQIPFEHDLINNCGKEILIDENLFGREPVSAEVLNINTPFIDIGIPKTLKEAQTFIPKIINLK
ncbi:sugar phosphate nucleotidyltransferase [uncultured Prochlorococcus sp.]|uniref:sugar phosphate nucleotidyltransferase n=1 Tax=uncultured Prochlorococcus sp. TaxID=159733 RepID=UPI000C5FE6C2|nr:sugar phosphate nucleotidyltransferase [uncultured Prochlorococcus sp.]MBI96752.1 hypothetical protein [bacterium]